MEYTPFDSEKGEILIKSIGNQVWAFDVEWAPDPKAGRVLYDLPASLSDKKVMERMWQEGGATKEDPQPFLKTPLCRVLSIAAITRKIKDKKVILELLTLPHKNDKMEEVTEKEILEKFLGAVGKHKPQLVGFNSVNADLKILVQRAVINGVSVPEFAARPEKPWMGADYFVKENDCNVDLFQILSSWGKGGSLNEYAVLSGIPGKMGTNGEDVPIMWLDGKIREIVNYNEYDAITTYLLWLRTVHFAGLIKTDQYEAEQKILRENIEEWSKESGRAHLRDYIKEWDRLEAIHHS